MDFILEKYVPIYFLEVLIRGFRTGTIANT